MGSKSDYLEAKLLDHVLGATVYTAPATVYVALFSAAPSDAGGGTELSGNGYARVAVTNNGTNWPAATGTSPTSKSNGTAITFPAATTADWLAATHFAVFDSNAGGNMLIWGSLSASKTVQVGDIASFAIGALTWTED